MVRGARETATSALSLGMVFSALVMFDARVRGRFWDLFSDPASGMISPFGDRVGELGNALWTAARDQSIDNGPMVLFTVVGITLVVFMVRS